MDSLRGTREAAKDQLDSLRGTREAPESHWELFAFKPCPFPK